MSDSLNYSLPINAIPLPIAVIKDKKIALSNARYKKENSPNNWLSAVIYAHLSEILAAPTGITISSELLGGKKMSCCSKSQSDGSFVIIIESIEKISEKMFETIVDQAPSGILVHRNGNIVYANKKISELLGFEHSKELLGLNFTEYLPTPDFVLTSSLITNNSNFFNWTHHKKSPLIRKDGSIQWTDTLSCMILFENSPAILMHVRDITTQISLETQLERLAKEDALTGLPNRLYITDFLTKCVTLASKSNSEVSVLFIDLNGFKKVNDELGHNAGDEFIRMISQRFKSVLRSEDVIGRLGGDEFVVVLNKSTQAQAYQVCNRLLESLNQPFDLCDKKVYAGAAIGVSIFPHYAQSTDELLNQADEAMYAAKSKKINNFVDYKELEKNK